MPPYTYTPTYPPGSPQDLANLANLAHLAGLIDTDLQQEPNNPPLSKNTLENAYSHYRAETSRKYPQQAYSQTTLAAIRDELTNQLDRETAAMRLFNAHTEAITAALKNFTQTTDNDNDNTGPMQTIPSTYRSARSAKRDELDLYDAKNTPTPQTRPYR